MGSRAEYQIITNNNHMILLDRKDLIKLGYPIEDNLDILVKN
ncbi:hypothetical protein FHW36_101517 [Chitinophaga polysaccharea]|uniref:Uncharacterized protein n=1 Tax=Chitinophaga polysaccharea TaxID=1293035 RepID=A0A561Q2K3_9BACT|nr:hypothetical protein FHW36_101517 [Chitinophaga polysaccharea]